MPMETTPSSASMRMDLTSRELTIAELIHYAWQMFSEHLQTIGMIALVIFLPINLISAFLSNPDKSPDAVNGVSTIGLIIAAGLSLLIGVLVPVAISHTIRKHLDTQTVDFPMVIRFALSKWGDAVVTSLLLTIFMIGLTFLLVVPAVILGVFWAFAIYAVAIKDKRGMAALRYSKEVVQGRWWKVLGYLIVLGLLSGIISWLIGLPFVNVDAPIVTAFVSTMSDIVFSYTLVATALLFINLDAVRRTNPTNT